MRIPLSAPDVVEADIQAVSDVLRTPRLSLGPKLEEFERSVASYVGASYGIAVNSGSSGLHLCVRALKIGEGDEVILPSFTFIAAAHVIRYAMAVPIFIDIEPGSFNLNWRKIEAAVTPRTRAILIPHTFGCPAEVAAILQLARRHGLSVIEDACEAIGAEYAGKKVGTFGDMGVFAFYPNKQITTGEGGLIVTNDAVLAGGARRLRNQGRGWDPPEPGHQERKDADDWLDHTELGYSYRISEINCALGIAQMKRIDSILCRREAIARSYHEKLSGNRDLSLPAFELDDRKISWFVYVVRLSSRFGRRQRDWIYREMIARGIGCGRYFAPVHWQPIYQREACGKHDLLVTESTAERCLALPFFNRISEEQICEVAEVLRELISEAGR